jgi:tetratricopeptide (TPR) repeat protein
MRIFSRVLIVLALSWLAIVIFLEARDHQMSDNADPTKLIVLFLSVIAVAVITGALVALSLVPAIGDLMGGFLFNPNERVEKSPHADAMAKMAQGDYEGAIKEYRAAYERDPNDTLALSEIGHIYCDKLGNYEAAAETFESALQEELPPDTAAFISSRLVDVYWNYQRDAIRARQILIQIAENMPDTKHAANAQHRLREIDQSLEA